MKTIEIEFRDKECLVKVEIRYEDKKSISFSGHRAGGFGQITINPRTDLQQKLVDYWDLLHLNDMHAGTPEQELALKYCTSKDYKERCEYLKSIGLYEVEWEGKPYRYGTGWLTYPLPKSLDEYWKELLQLKIEILVEDDEYRGETLLHEADNKYELLEDFDYPDEVLALAQHLELKINDVDGIIHNENCRYNVLGTDYICGLDNDVDEIFEESIKNYIDDCVLPEIPKQYHRYFNEEDFIEDCYKDGRGHALNRYDDNEYEETVNGKTYYIYQE